MSALTKNPTVPSNGQIPANLYTLRLLGGRKARAQKSGQEQLEVKIEILFPDIVPNPDDPAQELSVAGSKGTVYLPIDPANKGYNNTFKVLGVWGLLDDSGAFDPDEVLEEINTGNVCATCVVSSQRDIHRYPPKPGQAVGDPILGPDGQPLSRGWRMNFISADDWVQRVETPAGLPPIEKSPF